jgi:hypothetical protein
MIHDAMKKLEKTTKFALLKSLEEGISIPSSGGMLSPNVKMRECIFFFLHTFFFFLSH